MITFVCPHCNNIITSDSEHGGKQRLCPSCHGELVESKQAGQLVSSPEWKISKRSMSKKHKRMLIQCAVLLVGLGAVFGPLWLMISRQQATAKRALVAKRADVAKRAVRMTDSESQWRMLSELPAEEQHEVEAKPQLGKPAPGGNQEWGSLQELMKSADQGNDISQTKLGICYALGTGVEKDNAEAVKWLRKSADQGNAFGQFQLGLLYIDGTGVEKDNTEAVKWFRKSADQGNAFGQCRLGQCYMDGTGVDKDDAEAVMWLRESADQGNAQGQGLLGRCYMNGTGVDKDDSEAFKWIRKSADQNDAGGQCLLGICYTVGTGVEKDSAEAVKWFRKSADQGNSLGQQFLGACYMEGIGVDKDNAEAIMWIKKAADQGDLVAVGLLSDAKAKIAVETGLGGEAPLVVTGAAGLEDTKVGNIYTVVLAGGVKLALCGIPAGRFTMGSPIEEGGGKGETQHVVSLTRGFWLGRTAATQAQWRAVMANNPSHSVGDDLPVQSVSWNDAMEFCTKLNGQGLLSSGWKFALPTEAQWEYACRAGTAGPWDGWNLDDTAWFSVNSGNKIHPVAMKKPNAWGLYDMHGNVLQWCADWYGAYPTEAVADPTGPSTGSERVHRGGSFCAAGTECRSAYRSGTWPGLRIFNNIGFRVAAVPAGRGENTSSSPSYGDQSGALATVQLEQLRRELATVNSEIGRQRARWQKSQNTINRLTSNRQIPVTQGSVPFFQCQAASQVIQEVEAGAPGLKARKAELEAKINGCAPSAGRSGQPEIEQAAPYVAPSVPNSTMDSNSNASDQTVQHVLGVLKNAYPEFTDEQLAKKFEDVTGERLTQGPGLDKGAATLDKLYFITKSSGNSWRKVMDELSDPVERQKNIDRWSRVHGGDR